jgi:phage-related tail fiber protein
MASTGIDRVEGLDPAVAFKAPCRVATTANITLSGAQTIDGVAITTERVLVWNQTNQSENGIYNATGTAWTRAEDFDGNRDVVEGTFVAIKDGTTYSGSTFKVTASDPITIGTTSITFALANPLNSTLVVGTAATDTYAKLLALDPDDYSAGDVVKVTGDGIAGDTQR